ncbi:MAG: signal peptidase II [Eubacteriales bacterium]|nr:signal peptidase II [Eubacteriales bacterium]
MAERKTGLVALAVILLDQRLKLGLKDANQALIPGIVQLFGVRNTGVSFGLFSGQPELVALFTLALIILAAAFLRQLALPGLGVAGSGLILGGAVGNLIDRVAHGAVIDYVQLLFINFPVFNLADACITLGAALIIISALFSREGRAA